VGWSSQRSVAVLSAAGSTGPKAASAKHVFELGMLHAMGRGLRLVIGAALLVVVGLLVYRSQASRQMEPGALGDLRKTEFQMRILPDFAADLPLFHGWASGAQVVDWSYINAPAAYSYAEGVFIPRGEKRVAGTFRIVANYHGSKPEPVSIHADFDLDLKCVAGGKAKRNTLDAGEIRLRKDLLDPTSRSARIWGYEADLGNAGEGRRQLCLRTPWPARTLRTSDGFDRGYVDTFWKQDWEAAKALLYSQVLNRGCVLAVGMPTYNAAGANVGKLGGNSGSVMRGDAFVGVFQVSIGQPTGSPRQMTIILDGVAPLVGLLTPECVEYQKSHAQATYDPARDLAVRFESGGKRVIIEYPLGMNLSGVIRKASE
jgi:hypothetical protein